MPSNVIQFLRGKGFDHKGRTLNQIRALPNDRLEKEHDVVQWMFPTDLPSQHCKEAPILTTEDIETMKEDTAIQDNLQLSLDRMIRFYEADSNWITKNNHNFLRITRILRCLWLAGRTHDYVCLSRVLDDIYTDYSEIISEETFLYWKNANNGDFLKNYKPKKKVNVYDIDDYNEDEFNYVEYL